MDTPMLRQYQQLKSEVPDALLFFRLGDFYELFLQDAEIVSKALDITLTGRGKDENRVPMCGVPYHALDPYVQKLIQQGHKVAICEQVEDPSLTKGLTKRDIVRVVTPGMNVGGTLPADESVYLAGLMPIKSNWGVALLELSTGAFQVGIVSDADLDGWLQRTRPAECIGPTTDRLSLDVTITLAPIEHAQERLATHFKVASLDSFGIGPFKAAYPIAWAILQYAITFQKSSLPYLSSIAPMHLSDTLMMDPATLYHLDILPNRVHDQSLFHLLNRCQTAMGSRKLRAMLSNPLTHPGRIQARLDAVDTLVQSPRLMRDIQHTLRHVLDIERLLSRLVSFGNTPRDCVALRTSLTHCMGILPSLVALNPDGILGRHRRLLTTLSDPQSPIQQVIQLIERAIPDAPPAHTRDGGFIQDGFYAPLDELKSSFAMVKQWIAGLEDEEREATGIRVKVGFNKVFGYFIEVPHSATDRVPSRYIRKQTLANAERYITPELKEKETILLSGEAQQLAIELEVYQGIIRDIAQASASIQSLAGLVAELDVITSLAELAITHHYCKPILCTDNPHALHITEGRHPMIAAKMGARFTPNSVRLSTHHRSIVLTGPNMAGKSTLMRQCALMVVMAQMGSFVPATSFEWSVVDRLFTRIGASDNLAEGQSTFMVEMTETAAILRNATTQSLVLLDEIGRGTATFDGLSLAYAISDHLIQTMGPRLFFATHYHELTTLAMDHPTVSNQSMGILDLDGHIQFTYTLIDGPADSSFGIHVAKMAGLPDGVIQTARRIMTGLEQEGVRYLRKGVSHAH